MAFMVATAAGGGAGETEISIWGNRERREQGRGPRTPEAAHLRTAFRGSMGPCGPGLSQERKIAAPKGGTLEAAHVAVLPPAVPSRPIAPP